MGLLGSLHSGLSGGIGLGGRGGGLVGFGGLHFTITSAGRSFNCQGRGTSLGLGSK